MTGTQKQTVVAFDLYGTLLSTESIAKQLEPLCGAENAQSITVLWRRYQLEYTWRLNSMRMKPRSFSSVYVMHQIPEICDYRLL